METLEVVLQKTRLRGCVMSGLACTVNGRQQETATSIEDKTALVLGDSVLTQQVDNVSDLGVTVDSHLKFDVHVNQIVTY